MVCVVLKLQDEKTSQEPDKEKYRQKNECKNECELSN